VREGIRALLWAQQGPRGSAIGVVPDLRTEPAGG
jgi:hypothetical protein